MKAFDENGNEFEAVTMTEHEASISKVKEEISKTAEEAKKAAELARKEADELKAHLVKQEQNFKNLNDLSAEERAKLSAERIADMKRFEASEARAKVLEDKINQDTNQRILAVKEKALQKYHGGNKELKEALEKNYDLINLVGSTDEIIEERARLAANMEKGKMSNQNPLYAYLNGEGPRTPKKNNEDKFFESEKGKKASKLMGFDEPKK